MSNMSMDGQMKTPSKSADNQQTEPRTRAIKLIKLIKLICPVFASSLEGVRSWSTWSLNLVDDVGIGQASGLFLGFSWKPIREAQNECSYSYKNLSYSLIKSLTCFNCENRLSNERFYKAIVHAVDVFLEFGLDPLHPSPSGKVANKAMDSTCQVGFGKQRSGTCLSEKDRLSPAL